MAENCISCGWYTGKGEPGDHGIFPGSDKILCVECREVIEVGRAVMRMPTHASLAHGDIDKDGAEWLFFYGENDRKCRHGKTPLEALKGAKHD